MQNPAVCGSLTSFGSASLCTFLLNGCFNMHTFTAFFKWCCRRTCRRLAKFVDGYRELVYESPFLISLGATVITTTVSAFVVGFITLALTDSGAILNFAVIGTVVVNLLIYVYTIIALAYDDFKYEQRELFASIRDSNEHTKYK
jgi:hypothetical protein